MQGNSLYTHTNESTIKHSRKQHPVHYVKSVKKSVCMENWDDHNDLWMKIEIFIHEGTLTVKEHHTKENQVASACG